MNLFFTLLVQHEAIAVLTARKSELKITTPDSNINLAWSYDGNAIAVGDTVRAQPAFLVLCRHNSLCCCAAQKERISIIDPRNGKILYSYMSKTQVSCPAT